jgi:hypothetical protein
LKNPTTANITLDLVTDRAGVAWAQERITAEHYLHAPVDSRCRPLIYIAHHHATWGAAAAAGPRVIAILMFGRTQSTSCYQGGLTYGDQADVQTGRAQLDRWEILNLARVWVHPRFQAGGLSCSADEGLPGYTDRRGVWRSTLASSLIGQALAHVGYDYLAQYPPVDCRYPFVIRAVLSYCDRKFHKGTIYRASGFTLARTNSNGIETWYTTAVGALSAEQDADIRRRAEQSPRSRRIRAGRTVVQLELAL